MQVKVLEKGLVRRKASVRASCYHHLGMFLHCFYTHVGICVYSGPRVGQKLFLVTRTMEKLSF